MICSEREAVAAFCGKLSPHVRHDRHVLSQESWEKTEGEFICPLSPDLCADDVEFVEEILRDRMMAVGASSPAC